MSGSYQTFPVRLRRTTYNSADDVALRSTASLGTGYTIIGHDNIKIVFSNLQLKGVDGDNTLVP